MCAQQTEQSVPHVVIIGGGFGGLYAARALRRAAVRITLLDRRNHHLFQPLLYQVAMAALSPGDIASPIRWVLRKQQNVEVFLAEAVPTMMLGIAALFYFPNTPAEAKFLKPDERDWLQRHAARACPAATADRQASSPATSQIKRQAWSSTGLTDSRD